MDEQVKPAKKKIYKRWWFWVLAVIVFFIAVGAMSSKNNTPTKIGSDSQGSAKQTPEQTTFKIGDMVKRGDTVLTVKSVDKNWKSSNQFDKPQNPGSVYVTILVGIANSGSKDMSLSGIWDFKLTDAQGVKHDESLGGVGLNKLDSGSATSLAPSGTIAGNLIFEVPESSASNLTLEYQPLFSSGAAAEIQLQ